MLAIGQCSEALLAPAKTFDEQGKIKEQGRRRRCQLYTDRGFASAGEAPFQGRTNIAQVRSGERHVFNGDRKPLACAAGKPVRVVASMLSGGGVRLACLCKLFGRIGSG